MSKHDQWPIQVFISHANDSADRGEAVRHLWIFLRNCDIDTKVDLLATLHMRTETIYALAVAAGKQEEFYERLVGGLAVRNDAATVIPPLYSTKQPGAGVEAMVRFHGIALHSPCPWYTPLPLGLT